jgi:hypothetical protein
MIESTVGRNAGDVGRFGRRRQLDDDTADLLRLDRISHHDADEIPVLIPERAEPEPLRGGLCLSDCHPGAAE